MADQSAQAAQTLHDAITAFRKKCGDDPDCRDIINQLNLVERQVEKDYPATENSEKPGDPDEPDNIPSGNENVEPREGRSLRAANDRARTLLRARRNNT